LRIADFRSGTLIQQRRIISYLHVIRLYALLPWSLPLSPASPGGVAGADGGATGAFGGSGSTIFAGVAAGPLAAGATLAREA
jgi:hypothetical protein